jgi:hypothetical protein
LSAFAGSSPIHTSSASKSKVNEAAARIPSGHIALPGSDPSPDDRRAFADRHPSFDGGDDPLGTADDCSDTPYEPLLLRSNG